MIQSPRLSDRLTLQLVNHTNGAVGGDNNEFTMLIEGLCGGWCNIKQSRPAGHTNDHGLISNLTYAEGEEASRPFVGNGIAIDLGTFVEIVNDSRIATPRAHHGILDPPLDEQSGKNIDVIFI